MHWLPTAHPASVPHTSSATRQPLCVRVRVRVPVCACARVRVRLSVCLRVRLRVCLRVSASRSRSKHGRRVRLSAGLSMQKKVYIYSDTRLGHARFSACSHMM